VSGRGSSISFELKDPSFFPSIIKDNPFKISNALVKEVFPRSVKDDMDITQDSFGMKETCKLISEQKTFVKLNQLGELRLSNALSQDANMYNLCALVALPVGFHLCTHPLGKRPLHMEREFFLGR
jgi:hypothetical protein